MLLGAGLPANLWDEAISHAVYLRNPTPMRALEGKTPYEAWFGEKPDISHLWELGCDVWVLYEQHTSKLAAKAKKGKLLGFIDGAKAICYYDSVGHSVKVSCNFAFHEETRLVEVPGLHAEGEPGRATAKGTVHQSDHAVTNQITNQTADQTGTAEKLMIRIPT